MASVLRAEYFVSIEDYLAGERISQQKHEYLAGVIYAMAGTSIGHDRIANNILASLHGQLRGKPCEAFSSDVKVRIQRDAANFFYYPDVTVDCSGAANQSLYAEEPRVIFEVISPDTERIDRGEKLRNYQSLPTLGVYAIFDQFHIAVSVYRRTPEGWTHEFLTELTDVLDLSPIGCGLPLASAYERTGIRV
jgi:Uma2 family endonuclease